jgi:DNA repair protein RecO (recombination protein O)
VSLVETPAVILQVIAYGDTSKILKLLTRDLGLVSAIAKGARRARARTGPRLDLFATGHASLSVRPQRELQTLTAFELTAPHGALAGDVPRFAAAAALCELALRCAPPEPHPDVFDTVAGGLDALASTDAADVGATALAACWSLVAALGFAPALDRCAACGTPVHGALAFSAGQGGALCALHRAGVRTAQLAPEDAQALAALVEGRLPADSLSPRHEAAHRRLLAGFVRQHLTDQRPLPALAFWDAEAWPATSL